MPRVSLFFLLFFILELSVIITVGSHLGALATISLLFASIVVGIAIVKIRARFLIQALHTNDAAKAVENNLRLLVLPLAGLLFIIPGFISDIIAVLILIPGLDKLIAKPFLSRMNTMYFGRGFSARFSSSDSGFSAYSSSQEFYSKDQDDSSGDASSSRRSGTVIDGTYTELAEDFIEHKTQGKNEQPHQDASENQPPKQP